MKKTLLAVTILPLFLTGCGYSFDKPAKNVEPIQNVQALHDVCVYRSIETMMSYDDAEKLITDKLTALNISHNVTTRDNLANCSYTFGYDIRRGVSVPTYLANMNVIVNDSERYLVGSIQYSHNVKGGFLTMSSATFTSTDAEINKLLDQLLNVQ